MPSDVTVPFYHSDAITLYHGNCLEVMPGLAAQSFDAIITDVPYGTTACAWDSPIPFVPMWACLKRLARPRAAVVLFGSQPFTSALVMSNPGMFKYSWVWHKSQATGHLDANRRPMKEHEDIAVFCEGSNIYNPQITRKKIENIRPFTSRAAKTQQVYGAFDPDTPRTIPLDMTYPRSVLKLNNVLESGRLHPTQKPLALMEYLIRTYTNEGDTVLDFTSGSGTTLRAAKNLKRRAVGIERELHYCEVTVKRLEPAFEEALIDNGAALDDLPMFAQEFV
jgi:site-specific DNA-methyltransferase (adenine-specific)